MAVFVSISGPSTTGRSSLVNSLSTYQELSNAVFSPDMQDVVWNYLKDVGTFEDFTDITSDPSYMCVYILQLIDFYNTYLDDFEGTDKLVILDGCWLDLAIYSTLNLWYTRAIKSVQENIFASLLKYDNRISKIYITRADDERYPVDKYRLRGRLSAFRMNRPLEIQYYELFKNLKNVSPLPSSDISDSSLFILEDLKKLGHL